MKKMFWVLLFFVSSCATAQAPVPAPSPTPAEVKAEVKAAAPAEAVAAIPPVVAQAENAVPSPEEKPAAAEVAPASTVPETVCTLKGKTRKVFVEAPSGKYACRSVYDKEGKTQDLWSSKHSSGVALCNEKAASFVKKLQKEGWDCK